MILMYQYLLDRLSSTWRNSLFQLRWLGLYTATNIVSILVLEQAFVRRLLGRNFYGKKDIVQKHSRNSENPGT